MLQVPGSQQPVSINLRQDQKELKGWRELRLLDATTPFFEARGFLSPSAPLPGDNAPLLGQNLTQPSGHRLHRCEPERFNTGRLE